MTELAFRGGEGMPADHGSSHQTSTSVLGRLPDAIGLECQLPKGGLLEDFAALHLHNSDASSEIGKSLKTVGECVKNSQDVRDSNILSSY